MKLREVNAQLLNKNTITDIQKKLAEYPRYIMSIVDFSFAAQRIIEKHMQSIAKLSSSGLQQQALCQRQQQQQQKDNSQLQLEQITGIQQQNGQILELHRDSVGYMGVLLGAAEKMFNDKERVFSNASQGAVQELGSVIQDVEQTQNSLQQAGLSEYREEERSFFNQLNLFKECCQQTTKKVDSYSNALIDPSLIYNTKQQVLKWNQLGSQYSSLLQMQIGISDHLELFQTKRKALAINLQELLEQNKQALIKAITLFQRFTQTSAPQFIHLFFFLATYLHDHTKSLRATKEKSRIRQSQTAETIAFTAEPQIQKQSLQRQDEISRSLKYLEGLKACYDISAKNLKELLTEFESKNKHAIIRLMGKESAVQLNNLLNSVQIVSSEFYRQSKIIQVASQQITYHLQTLQNCHTQVFTGLNRSLSDHSNIKNEFKKSLETYQSQDQKELNGVRDCQWNIIVQLEQSCRDLISHSEKITENDHIHALEDLPNSPARFNSLENVNTKLIEAVAQNTLETDKVLSVLYVDLKEEIAGLGQDFEKTEFFDYQIVEQLTPPQGMQPLVGPRVREQSRKRQQSPESFVSFEVVSDNEEEKISARPHDQRRQSTNSDEYFYAEKHSKVKNQGESTEQQHQSSSQQGAQAHPNHSLHHVSSPSLHHHLSVQESQTKKEELVQHEKFIRQRTIWSEGEELKHHFSCAFAQRINLQGRIYITNLRLIFHSYFNGNTIFFNETLLEIPKSDIRIIHKRKNMLFLDNAIQIDVIKGSLLFTGFIYRDAAFDAIVKVLQPSQMGQISNAMQVSQARKRTLVEIDEDLNSKGNDSVKLDNDNEDESDSEDCTEQEIQQQIAQRRENIENGMKQNDSFKHVLIQTVLKGANISIKDLFQSCLSDSTYAHQGSNSSSESQIYQNYFFYYIKNVMKCWDISIENWSPPPPAYFLKSSSKDAQKEKQEEKVQKWLEISQRQINYDKGIPFSGIPFIPKSCHVQEKQKLYFISVDSLVFELEVYSSGVPMADTFYLIIRNSFSQLDSDSISYKVEMDVRILKSTWLSATLESQCIKEGTTSSTVIAQYFQERITEFMAANKKQVAAKKSQAQDGNNILRSSTNLYESGEAHSSNNNNQHRKFNLQSPVQESQQLRQSKQNNSRNNNRNQSTQQLSQSSKERETRILKTLDPIELYTTKLFEMQLGDSKVEITPFEAFRCLFGETTTLCKGYSDPYQCLKVEQFKDTKYQTTKWDPPLIDIFSTNKQNNSLLDFSKREVQFVHPLPPSSIPFMPKECTVKEIQTCYQLSDKLIIMNSEVFTSGVPKGDSFTARLRMTFEQISPNVIRYSQHSYMNFIKSTFLQGAIEKASIEQQQIAAKMIQSFTGDLINAMISQKRQQLSQHAAPGASNILKRLPSSAAAGNTHAISAKCLDEMEHRKRRILSEMEPNDKFTQKVIEKSFSTASTTGSSDVSLQEFIYLMFSESLPFEGCSDFIEYIKVVKSADKDFTQTRYNPTFPAYFSSHKISPTEDNLQALLKSVDMSERQITYTHPMPPTSIPFMPKTCKIKEIHKIYFISPELVVLNIEVFTSGVPKCDTFSVRMRQIFRQVHAEHRIEFTLLAYVQFFENTILAGKIQSSAIEQQTLSAQAITVPNYENAMNLLRNRRQSKESPHMRSQSHTKNQYSLHRISSIHLADDGEERISPADCSPNYQPRSGSNVFKFSEQQKSKVQQRRSSINQNKQNNATVGGADRTLTQQDQVVKLTENIESMNNKFKLFMIGFVVIYVTTLLGFLLKS